MGGISAHGVVVTQDGTPITELRGVTLPDLSRDVLEKTRLSDDDERSQVGIRKYGDLRLELNLVLTDPTHQSLLASWVNGVVSAFETITADGSTWSFDGWVVSFEPSDPVDGVQSAIVLIRPTSGIALNPLICTELEETITTENGDSIEIE